MNETRFTVFDVLVGVGIAVSVIAAFFYEEVQWWWFGGGVLSMLVGLKLWNP